MPRERFKRDLRRPYLAQSIQLSNSKNNHKKTQPLEKGENFIYYHLAKFKHPVFNKENIRHKETGKYGSYKGKQMNKENDSEDLMADILDKDFKTTCKDPQKINWRYGGSKNNNQKRCVNKMEISVKIENLKRNSGAEKCSNK